MSCCNSIYNLNQNKVTQSTILSVWVIDIEKVQIHAKELCTYIYNLYSIYYIEEGK